jgi:hypothetical protein
MREHLQDWKFHVVLGYVLLWWRLAPTKATVTPVASTIATAAGGASGAGRAADASSNLTGAANGILSPAEHVILAPTLFASPHDLYALGMAAIRLPPRCKGAVAILEGVVRG